MSRSIRQIHGRSEVDAAVSLIAQESLERDPRDYAVADGQSLIRRSDTLLEEWIDGEEFCVDGIVDGPRFCAVVHQKACVEYFDAHVEDGSIFTPIARRKVERRLKRFVQCGVRALGIDKWVFHAEVRMTRYGPRFIEINPRPAGGLLWKMSALHLGIDQFEFVARSLLGIPTTIRDDSAFTERAIYIRREARAASLPKEVPRGFSLEYLQATVAGTLPKKNQESYQGFLLVGGPKTSQARKYADEIADTIQQAPGDNEAT